MDKKFFVEDNSSKIKNNLYHPINDVNNEVFTNDGMVNDFLNKNVSLESLIENEIFKIK